MALHVMIVGSGKSALLFLLFLFVLLNKIRYFFCAFKPDNSGNALCDQPSVRIEFLRSFDRSCSSSQFFENSHTIPLYRF